MWPLSDEGARRSLLGDVEVFIHDVKAYFAWHRQIAATAAGEASRLAVMENNKRPSGHFMAPITSASYLPKFVGNADLAVRDLGSISNSRVPPLTIQLPVYSSTLHSPTATLLSDRTSTEGSNSLSQSPRAFSGYSPRATSFASTWDSVPNSVLGGEFHSPRSVGSASWTDPRAVGPSHPVSSREEFQSVFGTFSRQDDRIPLQPTQRPHAVPDTFSLFGNHDASFLKRPSEVYTPQAPQSSLPSPQHVPYQSQHSFRPPPVVARVQAIGPPHRELMLFAPSQPPQLPIGSRNNFPSMSILGAHLPVVTPTKSFDDRADSRVSCIGDGRPPAESLRGPFQVPETVRDPWVPTCSDNENHPSYLPGLGGSSNIWRMQNDEKKKPSGWSLF